MNSEPPRFRHLAIEGTIGAGKTTLARRLAGHLGAELLLEAPAENPFLDQFYADMAGYALQTQLFFLLQRQKQWRAIAQPSMFAPGIISDFMFEKDEIFARLTLSDDEHRLYAQLRARIAGQTRPPDFVVWLQASPETLLARVRRRGVAMERSIDLAYLRRLDEAYAAFFSTYDGSPVLAVDTEEFDPIGNDADFARLVERLGSFDGRREWMATQADALR